MRESLQDVCRRGYQAYAMTARVDWTLDWPGQIVLCASQMYWTKEVEESIHSGALPACEQKNTMQLQAIVNKVGVVALVSFVLCACHKFHGNIADHVNYQKKMILLTTERTRPSLNHA